MVKYELPHLKYEFNALEPVISARIMELHYSKHHQAYVDGANKALETLANARENGVEIDMKSVMKALSFNLNGHIMHSVFWDNMRAADENNAPTDRAREAIEKSFGNYEAFWKEFSTAAKLVEGAGWAALVQDDSKNLFVTQVENQNKLMLTGMKPILLLDVWEHAYYLQYENNRAAYVENFWKVIDWNNVEERLS